MRAQLRAALESEEGRVGYVYPDSLGYETIGVGHLVDKRRGGKLPDVIINALLDYDLDQIDKELDHHIAWWRTRPDNVQLALAQMAFQLGVPGLLSFKQCIACCQAGDYEGAKAAALNSKWARDDTPARAKRVAALFTTNGDLS